MSYRGTLTPRAERDLRRLPADVSRRVIAALMELQDNPRPRGSRKLAGSDEWRVRVGDYRVLYRVDDSSHQFTVTRIAHRRDVYRP